MYLAQAGSTPLVGQGQPQDNSPENGYEQNKPAQARDISRCPFCGHMTYTDDIEAPNDYCHHEIVRNS